MDHMFQQVFKQMIETGCLVKFVIKATFYYRKFVYSQKILAQYFKNAKINVFDNVAIFEHPRTNTYFNVVPPCSLSLLH